MNDRERHRATTLRYKRIRRPPWRLGTSCLRALVRGCSIGHLPHHRPREHRQQLAERRQTHRVRRVQVSSKDRPSRARSPPASGGARVSGGRPHHPHRSLDSPSNSPPPPWRRFPRFWPTLTAMAHLRRIVAQRVASTYTTYKTIEAERAQSIRTRRCLNAALSSSASIPSR